MASFATDGAALAGQWPGRLLGRLADLQVPPQDIGQAPVDWQAQGQRLPVPAGEAEVWLALQVQAPVWLTCQRCLQPMATTLALDRRLRFVQGQSQAEALDADSDDDVLALSRWLNLRELVEDELLLALPLVPRHETCPQPLPVPIGLEPADGADPVPDDIAQPDRFDSPNLGRGSHTDAGAAQDGPADGGRPNPFAVLRSLKPGGGGRSGA